MTPSFNIVSKNKVLQIVSSRCPMHISHRTCLVEDLKYTRRCPTCRKRVRQLKMVRSGDEVTLPPLNKPRLVDIVGRCRSSRV
ncbi:hypothetical protein PRIPAC_96283 [Pristionchus pacificus]|uniref:Uncharacterized protein n=1 Tax=Pristionchus pacificus TaxID=54126 RepID=A0A2A6B3D5_PRIPA|nr:hypothetical protein PRIPAC_96283 [Pristionchus pacificus]|eukprot:PDM60387.1 hypothetical protein PRIPAC_54212 [Pristionchus pacificus]